MSAKDEEYDRDAGLANLTDEERAALAEDELDEGEKAALQEIAGEGGDDDESDESGDDDGEDNEDDDGETSEAKPAESSESKPAKPEPSEVEVAGSGDQADDSEDDADDVAPVAYHAQLPEDFDDRVKALEDSEAELEQKFEAGDIEKAEYSREMRRIAAERNELDRVRVKAEVAAEMSQQAAFNQWQRQVEKFMREAKKVDGIDYRGDEALGAELDTMVKALANNPAHADKPSGWFLQQAHKAVKAMHGIADKPVQQVKNDKPASRKPPIDKAPKTLAQVPGGDGPGDVGDEFANLDNLEGDEYESALARLTPAQRGRYLASV